MPKVDVEVVKATWRFIFKDDTIVEQEIDGDLPIVIQDEIGIIFVWPSGTSEKYMWSAMKQSGYFPSNNK